MTATDAEPETWYWCLTHGQVESGSKTNCPPDDRLGPYESAEAATNWREKVDTRNETWDREDKEWSGDD